MTAYEVSMKGREVKFNSELDNGEALKILRGMKSNSFAQSLLKQWDDKRVLSAKQWAWVHKLACDNPAPAKEDIVLASLMYDIRHFVEEHGHKVFNVRGQAVQLKVAGLKAKLPGSINITDGEKFGKAKWFGRIIGKVGEGVDEHAILKSGHDMTQDVFNFIQMFGEDPEEVILSYETM